jgi:hypothetical protein
MSKVNKTLKFIAPLATMILEGKKTSTWRMFDEKNLSVGDTVDFVSSDTMNKFATAQLTEIKVKRLGELQGEDYKGHEEFKSKEEMYATYRKYYGGQVGPETEVKIVRFKLVP